MDNTRTIHIIHAIDADEHIGYLKGVFSALASENRITSFTTITNSTVNIETFSSLGADDMVVLMLTNSIVSDKSRIEELLLNAKFNNPNIKIAEILVDNVTFESQFIVFPIDLMPIQSKEDTGEAWDEIGQSLRNILPIIPNSGSITGFRKKYGRYILGAIALIIPLIIIVLMFKGDGHIEISVEPYSHNSNCPEVITFIGTIEASGPAIVKYRWLTVNNRIIKTDSIQLSESGTANVIVADAFGQPGKTIEGWVQLEILEPFSAVSERADFSLTCLDVKGRLQVLEWPEDYGENGDWDEGSTGALVRVVVGEISAGNNLKIRSSGLVVHCFAMAPTPEEQTSAWDSPEEVHKAREGQDVIVIILGKHVSTIQTGDLLDFTEDEVEEQEEKQ